MSGVRRGRKLTRKAQEDMGRKRSKVPGTPGQTLQAGQGLVVCHDVQVSWVCTGEGGGRGCAQVRGGRGGGGGPRAGGARRGQGRPSSYIICSMLR